MAITNAKNNAQTAQGRYFAIFLSQTNNGRSLSCFLV